jgi:hypothetical protein
MVLSSIGKGGSGNLAYWLGGPIKLSVSSTTLRSGLIKECGEVDVDDERVSKGRGDGRVGFVPDRCRLSGCA